MNIHHLKRSFIGCVLLIAALSRAGETKKYNIILLFADDISAREFPAYESTVWTSPAAFGVNTKETRFRAKTPALDRLSERGAYVETCWANAVCSP